ncbi:STAS domain-containing protein [Lentzea sp. HUAS12]|uniref:STAS domain-containing protein n=1 Tax=Lentzea sp. HUAS12 TaxID=2951806 RepID=UPI00209ECA86|nr:STAS domain-containing protein [Lentzea sp. HUAS12]USX53501.1 hypothetical protein ND450_05200 [Lentzea sp. HUAS12]
MARISRTDLSGVVVLTTTGALDAATAAAWQSSAAEHGLPPGHALVLDLRETDFIAIAGIRAIGAVADHHDRETVLVLAAGHHLRDWIGLLGTRRHVRVVDRLGAALALFRQLQP